MRTLETGRHCPAPASIERGHLTRWVARRGWRVGRIFEETCSPSLGDGDGRLDEALARVESHESDGLVVARLQHLGRSLGEAVAAIERISAAGGRFVSVCDGLDLGTPRGRLLLRLLFLALEW